MLRGIPAIETFQIMKCANQVTGEGGGTEIIREWNSQARARPPHLGGEGGMRGLEGWRGRSGSEGEQRGETNKSRDTKTEGNSEIMDE